MTLTQARLKELLHYDPETGVFIWLEDRLGGEYRSVVLAKKGAVAGFVGTPSYKSYKSYVFLTIDNIRHRAHRAAWLYVYGVMPTMMDHKNGDGTDNRLENLRECTKSQNMCNVTSRNTSKTGIKGVMYYKRSGKYHAQIKADGKRFHLGFFAKIEDAALAYKEAAHRLHGEFARTE